MAALLEVRNLTTRFRTGRGLVTAVDHVSFDVSPGETVAIVGESGSGKSVTALSLLRLIPSPPGRIEEGEVLFENQDLLRLDDAGIRKIRGNRIAMIREMTTEILDKAPYIWLPTPYIFTAWWPWVKNYGGELRAGAVRPGPIYARIWIDRELKKKMGF